jgi:hypothetical protein
MKVQNDNTKCVRLVMSSGKRRDSRRYLILDSPDSHAVPAYFEIREVEYVIRCSTEVWL